jgi:hypothetical protein
MTTLSPITIRQGDDVSRTLTITDDAGDAINITGCTLTFNLRLPGAAALAITPAPTLALTDAANGVATLVLTDTQTAALTARKTYTYEISVSDATGLISSPVEGLLYVGAQVG